jgi:hypothetical protein
VSLSLVGIVKARRIIRVVYVARGMQEGNVFIILVRNGLGKRSFGRLERICKENIKMNLTKISSRDGRPGWLQIKCNENFVFPVMFSFLRDIIFNSEAK